MGQQVSKGVRGSWRLVTEEEDKRRVIQRGELLEYILEHCILARIEKKSKTFLDFSGVLFLGNEKGIFAKERSRGGNNKV